MSTIHIAAEALRSDPLFLHLSEDEQWDAARAQLAVQGLQHIDPLDMGIVLQLARKPAKGAVRKTPAALPAPIEGGGLLAKLLDAAPYTHIQIAEAMGCSRSLVTQYVNGTMAERLTPENGRMLAELCRRTIAQLTPLIEDFERIGAA